MPIRVLAVAAALATLAAAPFHLPAPTGPHPVGTTSWTLADAARGEPFAPGERRQVKVVAWYPAAAGFSRPDRAPYLRESLAEARAFARLIRAADGSYDAVADVETHAFLDAPPLNGARLPLIVFSHGYGGVASAHAALLEDLASHGYAVLSIVHPYESAATRFDRDRVVSMLDDSGVPRAPYRDVIAEWAKEDETMTAVTGAAAEDDQRRLLRAYLSTIPQTTVALQRWVDDIRAVLDQLRSLDRSSPAARLTARVDASVVGVFGHSMGGVAAADFCAGDRRCRAALNLDGIPQYGSLIDRTMPAPMLMVYSARPGRLGANDAIYGRAASTYYRVDVSGTKHLDFSDLNFWGGRLREVPALGDIDPARAADVVRTIVREYFDQELRSRPSRLFSGARTLDGVTVHPRQAVTQRSGTTPSIESQVGKVSRVCGTVASASCTAPDPALHLMFDSSPVVNINVPDRRPFPVRAERGYLHARVCAIGEVRRERDAYEVVVHGPAQLTIETPPADVLPDDVVTTCDEGMALPRLLEDDKPQYTADALRAKIQGKALVEAIVGTDGVVSQARIVRSLDPYFGLDASALESARKWRFAPATRDGRPVRCLVTIEMQFVIAR